MKKHSLITYIVIAAALVWAPSASHAASVYLEASKNTISVGDTVIVTAKISAEGVAANTVEGDVILKSGASTVTVQEFSLASSSFGLWPRTPSLSKDGQTISFVGGVPGGFNIEGATLFKVILEAKKEGTLVIAPQNISVYASDGKATKLPVTSKSVTIKVGARKAGTPVNDEWRSIVSSDITDPGDFIIVLGQDAALFEGKKFAFFSALDNQSGISYYEVSENGAPAVRSGSTYVLQDQKGNVTLSVTAIDKAGNKKVALYPIGGAQKGIAWLPIIVVVLCIVIARSVVRKMRKGKINVETNL